MRLQGWRDFSYKLHIGWWNSIKLINQFKVVLLGAYDVGRKQIFELLTPGEQDKYIITYGTNFRVVQYPVMNSTISLNFWDWAGKDKIIDANMFTGTNAFIGLFRKKDPRSIQILQEQLALGLNSKVKETYLLLVGLGDGFKVSKLPLNEVRTLFEPVLSSQLARFDYIELEDANPDVSMIPNTIIPQLMDLEKRCGNCYKVFDEVLYKEGFYFCSNCFQSADVEKAKAFVRIHGDHT